VKNHERPLAAGCSMHPTINNHVANLPGQSCPALYCIALPCLVLSCAAPPPACSLGFTVGRLFVPGDGPDLCLPSDRALVEPFEDVWAALQPEAGVFDEAVFQVWCDQALPADCLLNALPAGLFASVRCLFVWVAVGLSHSAVAD
jgi:hypothetical protein